MRRRIDQRSAAGADARIQRAVRPRRVVIDEHGQTGRVVAHLARQLGRIAVRGERDDAEPVTVTVQHVQSAPADRAGRAEQCDAFHQNAGSTARSQYVTGIVKKSASNRSSTPPCPGSSEPESFTPASRLSSDSARSPICATGEMISPISAPVAALIGTPSHAPKMKWAYSAPAATVPITLDTAPSTVFAGLTAGIS